MELFISDLDGTLLNSSAKLSEYTAKKLNELIGSGLNFTAATARSLSSFSGLFEGVELKLPVILMNGVLIYDPVGQKYDVVNYLSDEVSKRILSAMRRHGLDCIMYTLKDGAADNMFERLTNSAMAEFYETRRSTKCYRQLAEEDRLEDNIGNNIYFTFLDTYERLIPLCEELKNDKEIGMTMYNDIYAPDFWYLEIFSAKATKENGVRYLRQKLDPEKVTAFGDNLNDLSLFAAADVKIAVSNAKKELTDSADRVIGSNDEDGVVKYLAMFLG